jgi:phage terminase small subunit
MKRGPKPKQVKLREQEGAFRGGKTQKPAELPTVLGRPSPSILVQADDLSLAIYNETCDILQTLGILTEQDGVLLEAFALNYRELALCVKDMQQNGIEAETQRGNGKSSVHTTNYHKFLAVHLKMIGELGLMKKLGGK